VPAAGDLRPESESVTSKDLIKTGQDGLWIGYLTVNRRLTCLQETDKATIDVEAQDDGVMGKILFPSGSKNVPVGETIAVLAEQGDDLSKLEVPTDLSPPKQDIPTEDGVPEAPKEEPKAAAPAAPAGPAADHHSKPMFPSVAAL
jgi:pyruvate/2-oxoglutarate dehydrogenase complex dihydrolipoamide acyltransferase (E2) component